MSSGALEVRTLKQVHAGLLNRLGGLAVQILRQPMAIPAVAVIAIVAFCAVAANLIAPYDPIVQAPLNGLASPSADHWLGTDHLGRDVLSRMIYGSRVALVVGVGAVAFGAMLGVPLGLVAGYLGRLVDDLIMRVMDALVAFPGLILTLSLVAVFGRSERNLVVAIGIANVPWIARIVRAQALALREQDFVVAARAIGASHGRIMAVHILPNSLAPVIVQSTLGMGYAILAEASLSYIGAGIQPPTPTWGSMLQFAFGFLHQAPLLSIIPGMAIFLLVLAFNLLGDILRDVLDPRLRGAR